MLTLTQTEFIHAAILSNFLYGALLLARAPDRMVPDGLSTLWIAATGAVGHLIHASMLPDEHLDGKSSLWLAFDIVLVFANLLLILLTLPRFVHLVMDATGTFLGY